MKLFNRGLGRRAEQNLDRIFGRPVMEAAREVENLHAKAEGYKNKAAGGASLSVAIGTAAMVGLVGTGVGAPVILGAVTLSMGAGLYAGAAALLRRHSSDQEWRAKQKVNPSKLRDALHARHLAAANLTIPAPHTPPRQGAPS